MTAPAAEKPGRITSLDVSRGVFLVTSVTTSAVLRPRPAPLVHAEWHGVTFYDLIFPLFVTLSGIGLAFAYRNQAPWWVTARRVVVLLLVGLAYNGLATGDTLSTFRVTGPLQVYSVIVLVIAVLHVWIRSALEWAIVTAASAVALTVFHAGWASQCRTERLVPGCNPSATIDGFLLGPHMYAQGSLGHDPEGIVAIAGALVTACVGVTAGHLSVRYRHDRSGSRRLLTWAAGTVVLGIALTAAVEPMKRLWTPSFALLTGGLGVALFTAAFLIFDVPAERRWTLCAAPGWPHRSSPWDATACSCTSARTLPWRCSNAPAGTRRGRNA